MKSPFTKFNSRSNEIEIMDDLACEGEVVYKTLYELDVINSWLGGNSIVLNALKKEFRNHISNDKTHVIKIIDLGCGSGTMLLEIAKLAMQMGIKVDLVGVDANPFIIEYAKRNCLKNSAIRFQVADVIKEINSIEKSDIIICSLFCHHFSDLELATLIASWKNNTKKIIINDIHRHWLAYYSIFLLTALFSKSSMVKYDAKLSVLRAFKKSELISIFKSAKVQNYRLKWRWAFRYEAIMECDENEGKE